MRGFQSILILAGLLLSGYTYAYTSPGAHNGYVNDFANILTPAEEDLLEQKLTSAENASGIEIAVTTVPNLSGDTIENYAVQLFKEWGIGKKSSDNGVLLLMTLEERGLRIEVGYGLEGDLTDAESYAIINNVITPQLAAGNYFSALNSGVDEIARSLDIAGVPSQNPVITPQPTSENMSSASFDTIIFFAVAAAVLAQLARTFRSSIFAKLLWVGTPLFAGFVTFVVTNSIVFALVAAVAVLLIFLLIIFSGGGSGGSSGGISFGGSSRSGGSFGGGHSGGGGASGRW